MGTSIPSTCASTRCSYGPPAGEARQIGGDVRSVGVEDMRPVAMHENAVVVVVVEGVAADVRPSIDQQHPLACARGETFGEHAAREAGADDQIVKARAAKRAAGRAVGNGGREGRASPRCAAGALVSARAGLRPRIASARASRHRLNPRTSGRARGPLWRAKPSAAGHRAAPPRTESRSLPASRRSGPALPRRSSGPRRLSGSRRRAGRRPGIPASSSG